MGGLIVFVVAVAIVGWAIYSYVKGSKEQKAKGIEKIIIANHIEGIPFVNSGQSVSLCLYKDKITVITVNDGYEIPLRNIENINIRTEEELTEKERSVIGRSLVGAALLGPVGAIIGGLSGVKNKKKTETKKILFIDFKDQKSEISNAKFVTGKYTPDHSFVEKTKDLLKADQ